MDMDVIGMTNMTEARLAREAQMHYATLAMVTDYDCWKEDEIVTVERVLSNLAHNTELSQKILQELFRIIEIKDDCGCRSALDGSIQSVGEGLDKNLQKKYELLFR